ncbi:MAG: D-glycero-beta-D-manno-heptose-7-phosphate kinase [Nanoarchaeota archaeon]
MKQRLLKILEKFKGKKILVIGDIMLDKYIWGEVSRISPEAPVQVVHVQKETYAPGGASNVANNISALNGKAFMVGIVGNDEPKNILLDELKKRGINIDGIFTDNDKPTTQKVRIVGRNQQLLRVDYEKKEHAHQDIEKSIMLFLRKIVKEIDAIVISDYAKGVITPEICNGLIKSAKEHKKLVIVDPKPKHLDLYRNVDLITPNNAEASEMTNIEDGGENAVVEMGRKLVKYLNANVLITRGEEGMSLFEKNFNIEHIPAKAREVYSLIGAGDTVVATIALALAAGANLEEASILSNSAAGIKVGKLGTASVAVEEIMEGLARL